MGENGAKGSVKYGIQGSQIDRAKNADNEAVENIWKDSELLLLVQLARLTSSWIGWQENDFDAGRPLLLRYVIPSARGPYFEMTPPAQREKQCPLEFRFNQ